MADFLAKYGIKEVADVTFYHLNSAGKPDYPVLYLDTLKVSTIEQTAEQTEARGGKGNPPLIIWDYGKEINVTLEDALFSAKSMAIMFGNGLPKTVATDADATTGAIMRTEEFTPNANVADATSTPVTALAAAGWASQLEVGGKLYNKANPKVYSATGSATEETALTKDVKYFVTYDLAIKEAGVIEISAASFPGTYYVTGDTYARSAASGEDEFFQFIIPKAKMNAENTITLEAEGDPSVFNMSLRVMRPDDGIMMKLVKYDLTPAGNVAEGATSTLIHNHNVFAQA